MLPVIFSVIVARIGTAHIGIYRQRRYWHRGKRVCAWHGVMAPVPNAVFEANHLNRSNIQKSDVATLYILINSEQLHLQDRNWIADECTCHASSRRPRVMRHLCLTVMRAWSEHPDHAMMSLRRCGLTSHAGYRLETLTSTKKTDKTERFLLSSNILFPLVNHVSSL